MRKPHHGDRHPTSDLLLQVDEVLHQLSVVEITRLFAWKPRWAMIMFVNSCARSTFDISSAPEAMLDTDALAGEAEDRGARVGRHACRRCRRRGRDLRDC